MKCVICKGTGKYHKPDYKGIEGEVKRLVAGGVSYREVMRIMGWKSPNTVQYYVKKQ